MSRRSRPSSRSSYDSYDYGEGSGRYPSEKSNSSKPNSSMNFNFTSLAILGGVFILGIGIGIGFSSSASTGVESVASREAIDQAAPNPELCVQYGASAIVTDMRVFVTLSPFNVFVTQPTMQPGCVLRSNNWSVIEQRGLLKSQEVRDCRNRLNTFAFVGPLEGKPQIDCVYQNDAAKNLFRQPGNDGAPAETNRY